MSLVTSQTSGVYDLGWGSGSHVWDWYGREVVVVAGEDGWNLTLELAGWPVAMVKNRVECHLRARSTVSQVSDQTGVAARPKPGT